jgi:UPF0755 protein
MAPDAPASLRSASNPSKLPPASKPAFLSKPSFLSKSLFQSKPAPGGSQAGGDQPADAARRSPISGQSLSAKPGQPPIAQERSSDASSSRHRIAPGLPPQPPPLALRKSLLRSDSPPLGPNAARTDAKAAGEPTSSAREAAKTATKPGQLPPNPAKVTGEAVPAADTPAKAGYRNPSLSEPAKGTGAAKPTIAQAARSAKVAPASPQPGRAAVPPGTPAQAPPGRVTLGAGEPEPPISGRLIDTLGPSSMEQKRITPRSPRAAIEPEHVRVPTRKRASRRARNPLVIIGNAVFTVLLLVLLVAGGVIVVGKSRFEAPGPLPQDKVVNIPRSGIIDIADLLAREGVIAEHRMIFIGGVLALKARGELKAGEYLFQKHASVRDVVETIVSGKVVQHQITIPEGLTSEQIIARLLENDILSGNIKDIPREGSLLPDSYHFSRGFMREQVIRRMQEARNRLVDEVWARRNPDLPLKTPEQLVVLASIVEKETGKPEERTRIAAVFVNRLKQKMKLQSDPTIIYGLVFGKGSLGRPLSKADIAHPTPYNTYIIDGLPPGPITNAGRSSIEAAANPARTKELYFVADGSGGHVFAETYEQHQKNVARLRVIEQELKEPPAANAQTPPRAPTPPQRPKRGGSSRSAGAR